MTVTVDERVAELEQRLAAVEARLAVRRPTAADVAAPAPPVRAVATPPAAAPAPARREVALEDLVGGRVLAWLGGAALLAGLALLFGLAVSSGWLGEAARCLLGGGAALALVLGGAWLHERRGRTEAARAMAASGVAGLFLAAAVAALAYEVVPAVTGLALCAAAGALAVVLALRWDAPVVGGLGLAGAALGPLLSGAWSPGALAFTWLAFAAGVAVLVLRRWDRVALALTAVVVPQWLVFLFEEPSRPASLLVLVAFGLPAAAAAVGFDLRRPAGRLRAVPALLLAGNALVLAVAGWEALGRGGPGIAWLLALGSAHALAGLAVRARRRAPSGLAILLLALGAVLADVVAGLWLDGAPRSLAWAAGGVALAALARRAQAAERGAALAGLGAHVAASTAGAALLVDAGSFLGGGGASAAVIAALGGLAASCLASAHLAPALRAPLGLAGLLAAAALAALALDGLALTAAWTAEAVALGALARRDGDALAGRAALAHLAAAAAWALADQAPPTALAGGLAAPGPAVLGMGAVALAAARAGRPLLAGTAALHLASALVVTFHPGSAMTGQLQLSGLWALAGVALVVAGLRRDARRVRLAGLGLLGLATAKVVVVDLATLEAAHRVGSFLVLGVLLLAGAFAWGRLRPAS